MIYAYSVLFKEGVGIRFVAFRFDSGASNELTKWVHNALLVGKQIIVMVSFVLDCLGTDDGTEKLSRNINTELPFFAA